jgi:hypothetical protein
MVEALGCFVVALGLGLVVGAVAFVAWLVKVVFSIALWPLALAGALVKAVLFCVLGLVAVVVVLAVGLPLLVTAVALALPLLALAAVVAGCAAVLGWIF